KVDARDGVVARVEAITRALGADDVDVVRQQVVDLADVERLVCAQMRDLSRRVHACVRASRAADVDVAQDALRGAEEMALDRFLRVTLRLPTGVASPLVFDGELVSRHAPRVLSGTG